jgi:glucose-6-phosphate-specific signal transduction histidine kinase
MNIFEKTYRKEQEMVRQFDATDDEEEKETIREAHERLMEGISEKGNIACIVWRAFETAKERGNEYIDFSEVIADSDVRGLLRCLRENGIERFTFSSTWSSAVLTAWYFAQEGCSLEGMVEINGLEKLFSEEREKIPGYLFRVN